MTNKPIGFRAAIVVAGLASLPGSAQGQDRGPGRGEKYALLVGVREYDPSEWRSLNFTEADATGMAEVLRGAGYGRVVLMTQTEGARRARALPTAKNIRAELKGLLEDRDPEDTVVVALAGHGVQLRGEGGAYFCPMDAKLADKETLISIEEVYRGLEECKAGVKLLLVDSCRNDARSNNARAREEVDLESVSRPQAVEPPGGVAALFSCSEGQKAFELDELKHGVFFHFVIRGLQGQADLDRDGVVDVEELARFCKKRVPDYVKDTIGPEVRQIPVYRGRVVGLPALITLGTPKAPEVPRSPDQPAAVVDPLPVGSVWALGDDRSVFTVLSREGDRFEARFTLGGGSTVRVVRGTVRGSTFEWLGSDDTAVKGTRGDDNQGVIEGDEIALRWSRDGGPLQGPITLRRRGEGPLPAGSVWITENRAATLTVLSREGDRFEARFARADGGYERLVRGTVRGSTFEWLAKDVAVERGTQGDDNRGVIEGDRMTLQWSRDGGPPLGKVALRKVKG